MTSLALWWKLTKLKHPDYPIAARAAKELAKAKDANAVAPLCELLVRSADPTKQALVVFILDEIGDTRAVPALIKALQQNSLVDAAISLGNFRDPRGFEPLLAALKSRDAALRLAAVEALGRFRDRSAALALEPLALNDPESKVRLAAANVLTALGADWGPPEKDIHTAIQNRLDAIKKINGTTGSSSMSQVYGIWSVHDSDNKKVMEQALADLGFHLKHFAKRVSERDLRNVAGLGELYVVWENRGCLNELLDQSKITFNVQDLRQMARQELVRRGSKV